MPAFSHLLVVVSCPSYNSGASCFQISLDSEFQLTALQLHQEGFAQRLGLLRVACLVPKQNGYIPTASTQ